MLKWKWNDKINMFIHGLLHGTRRWHYYSELYTCIQVLSHFYLFIFLHLRLFKHYLSLEMYYIKVMINFTKNNHFFFLFCISLFTTIFFHLTKSQSFCQKRYMLRIFTNPLTKQSCIKFISEQNCKLTFFQYSHSSGHCTYFSISLSYTYRVRVCSNNRVIVYRQIMH